MRDLITIAEGVSTEDLPYSIVEHYGNDGANYFVLARFADRDDAIEYCKLRGKRSNQNVTQVVTQTADGNIIHRCDTTGGMPEKWKGPSDA